MSDQIEPVRSAARQRARYQQELDVLNAETLRRRNPHPTLSQIQAQLQNGPQLNPSRGYRRQPPPTPQPPLSRMGATAEQHLTLTRGSEGQRTTETETDGGRGSIAQNDRVR